MRAAFLDDGTSARRTRSGDGPSATLAWWTRKKVSALPAAHHGPRRRRRSRRIVTPTPGARDRTTARDEPPASTSKAAGTRRRNGLADARHVGGRDDGTSATRAAVVLGPVSSRAPAGAVRQRTRARAAQVRRRTSGGRPACHGRPAWTGSHAPSTPAPPRPSAALRPPRAALRTMHWICASVSGNAVWSTGRMKRRFRAYLSNPEEPQDAVGDPAQGALDAPGGRARDLAVALQAAGRSRRRTGGCRAPRRRAAISPGPAGSPRRATSSARFAIVKVHLWSRLKRLGQNPCS